MPFLFWKFFALLTGRGWAAAIYPAGGDPSPSAPGQAAQHRQQGRPCPNAKQTDRSRTRTCTHARTLARCTGLHSIPDSPRGIDRTGGRRWKAGNSSIMRIVIALSQAWYIDSNMNKYHKDILLFLVIVNYYLSIDIQSY